MTAGAVLKRCHRFGVDGRRFAFEPSEMLIVEVDPLVDELLEGCVESEGWEGGWESGLRDRHGDPTADEVMEDLRDMGLIGSSEPPPPAAGPSGLTGITLNVTHGCNLRCTYCFAGKGEYGMGRARMSPATAKAAIDFLARHRKEDCELAILFFGGEPMMNMETVREASIYAKERLETPEYPIRLQMTTNGTLLTEKNVRTLVELGIHPQISLDGPPEVNDEHRIFATGRGSYDLVADGAARLKAATGRVSLRATVSAGRGSFFDTAVHFTDALGATRANFEPASCSDESSGVTSDDIAALNVAWSEIADECFQRAKRGEIWPIGKFVSLLEKIHWRRRGRYGCTAGMSAVAVVPDGDLYPCHRFVGNEAWKMGSVFDDTLDQSIAERFASNSVDHREPCRSCWARYLCSGRCVHEAMEVTGSIAEPDPLRCDMMRHLSEEALRLYVRVKPVMMEQLAERREPLAEERTVGPQD